MVVVEVGLKAEGAAEGVGAGAGTVAARAEADLAIELRA